MLARLFCNKQCWRITGLRALLLLGALSPVVTMACELALSHRSTFPVFQYDAFQFAKASAAMTLELDNIGDEDCEASLSVLDGSGRAAPFYVGSAGLKVSLSVPELQSATQSSPLNGTYSATIPAMASKSVTLNFFADQDVLIPAGEHALEMQIDINDSLGTPLLSRIVGDLRLVSQARAQVNIAGASGDFRETRFSDSVTFLNPAVGDKRRVFVQMRSNSNATLTLSSANGAVMRHAEYDDSNIAYSLLLDGRRIDLASPYVLSGLPMTGLKGVSLPLEINISALNNAFAGQYHDTVTVTVIPQ